MFGVSRASQHFGMLCPSSLFTAALFVFFNMVLAKLLSFNSNVQTCRVVIRKVDERHVPSQTISFLFSAVPQVVNVGSVSPAAFNVHL